MNERNGRGGGADMRKRNGGEERGGAGKALGVREMEEG